MNDNKPIHVIVRRNPLPYIGPLERGESRQLAIIFSLLIAGVIMFGLCFGACLVFTTIGAIGGGDFIMRVVRIIDGKFHDIGLMFLWGPTLIFLGLLVGAAVLPSPLSDICLFLLLSILDLAGFIFKLFIGGS